MKIGQTVRAKFKTLPVERAKSERSSVELCPMRTGRVTWIHPKGRFITRGVIPLPLDMEI